MKGSLQERLSQLYLMFSEFWRSVYWCGGTGKRDKLTKGTDSILVCLLETCLTNGNNLLRKRNALRLAPWRSPWLYYDFSLMNEL